MNVWTLIGCAAAVVAGWIFSEVIRASNDGEQ